MVPVYTSNALDHEFHFTEVMNQKLQEKVTGICQIPPDFCCHPGLSTNSTLQTVGTAADLLQYCDTTLYHSQTKAHKFQL